MIFDGIASENTPPTTYIMLRRSNSPPLSRAGSPAVSEISVGSPSPPPAPSKNISFALFNMKDYQRTAGLEPSRALEVAQPPPNIKNYHRTAGLEPSHSLEVAHPPPARRKSTAERVKSFSIADILGRNNDEVSQSQQASSEQSLAEDRHHQQKQRLLLDVPPLSNIVRPWDPVQGPIPMRPFFPPALLQYEQRLAWDYQRHLQEHFNAQAQLLRQMSMDPLIIPSEDGSERSRSSSAASDCCSPEVTGCGTRRSVESKTPRDSEAASCSTNAGGINHNNSSTGASGHTSTTSTQHNDTPLNALFQLSTKNFDEEHDQSAQSLFATRPNPKKKRKSRTAFTNHQIFQLEKRFLYYKYLSPAKRDEIASELGLSNAQVITWFQNRRAKLKRDMEELKKDVESVKTLNAHQSASTTTTIHQHVMTMSTLSQNRTNHWQILRSEAITAATSATVAAAAAATSIVAEDKNDLRRLKMMTLMYYSSRCNTSSSSNSSSSNSISNCSSSGNNFSNRCSSSSTACHSWQQTGGSERRKT